MTVLSSTLRAFHGDAAIKEKYVNRVRAHAAADHLVKGKGWEGGRGCAIGCTLEVYDSSLYPVELGLPEWLAHLEDLIFENLPDELAMTWPARLLSVIKSGVNVEAVQGRLAIRRMDRLLVLQQDSLEKSKPGNVRDSIVLVIAAIEQVKVVFIAEQDGVVTQVAWSAAESAAWSAAESAAWVAWSAAWSARSAAWSARSAAESAAWVAWSAAWSARSAAWSARSAAWSPAESAESAWVTESEDLLQLLSEVA